VEPKTKREAGQYQLDRQSSSEDDENPDTTKGERLLKPHPNH